LFGGYIFGAKQATTERRMPTWTRIASSLTLVVAGWSWLAFSRSGPVGEYAALLALGVTLGCIGDLVLGLPVPLREPALAGIAAFGLGHIAYIAALVRFGDTHSLTAPGPRYGALLVWLAVGAGGWYVIVARGRRRTALHWAALSYALLLAGTAGVATGLAL